MFYVYRSSCLIFHTKHHHDHIFRALKRSDGMIYSIGTLGRNARMCSLKTGDW